MRSAPLLGTTLGRHRLGALLVLLLFLLAALAWSPPSASAATLFGTVSTQTAGSAPAPEAGAVVTVIDPVHQAVVALASTGLDGTYSVAVSDGTYDVRFDPAAGHSYASSSVHNIQVTASRKLDVVLVPAGFESVSGVVDGPGGPVAGVRVWVGPPSGGDVAHAVTGADGSYSFVVAPGRYRVFAQGPVGRAGLPGSWRLNVTDAFDLDADRTFDFTLPSTSVLTVRVLGSDGAPVVGAVVRFGLYARDAVDLGSGPGVLISGSASGDDFYGTTDGDGELRVAVFDGSRPSGDVTIAPPDGSSYAQETLALPTVNGDTTFVVHFTPLDVTPPTIACNQPPTGWHTAEVSVACTASDVGSGLADPADASFSLTTSVSDGHEDAAAQTGTHQVCDRAGNCATAGPIGPIAIDRAAPVIAYGQANDGANGWWIHSPASVHGTATDLNMGNALSCSIDGVIVRRLTPRSGPNTREADLTVRGEGRHTVSCTAADTLGHSGTTNAPVLIDLKVPRAPLLTADRAPDYTGGGGWFADTVTVTTSGNGDPLLADGSQGSGVDPGSVPSSQTFTTSGSHVVSARVADVAGHLSAATRLTVKVDADQPATTLTCPTGDVALGSRSNARWADRDGESGLAGTATGTIALDTSGLGTHTALHTATDHVGHTATSRCAYRVVFGYRPVGSTRAPPTFNAVARASSPTLVMFTLSGNQGLAVFEPGYPQVQPVSCANGTPSGSPAAAQAAAPLAYAAGTDRYTYSWSSSGVATGTCVALHLGLIDGTVHDVWFRR
jgi:hypothetical protein